MPQKPKVSVFIASYNHAQFLPECLDSILTQTFQDFEIVIVDDGSTDGSHEILIDYQQRYPEKLFYFYHPGHANKGISASCNLAISKTRGDYLAWTGSDDAWYPEKLELQVKLLDDHPDFGLVYSYAHFIDRNGNRLPELAGTDITQDHNPLGRILQFCVTPAQTVVIRRECLESVGLFDENLVYSDWDLMIRIFARWKIGFTDRPLAKYRLHQINISKGIDPKVDISRILKLYEAVRGKAANIGGTLAQPRNQAILSLQYSFHCFCVGNTKEAEQSLSEAFEVDPSLVSDVDFFNAWLNNWKPAFYTTAHNHFGFWTIEHLPENIDKTFITKLTELQFKNTDTATFFINRGKDLDSKFETPVTESQVFSDWPKDIPLPGAWKNHVLGVIYPTLLFENYEKGNFPKAFRYWGYALRYHPKLLKNRGVWSIGLKTLLYYGKIRQR